MNNIFLKYGSNLASSVNITILSDLIYKDLFTLFNILSEKDSEAGSSAGAGAGEAAEEKTEFDVELTEVGGQKVKVMSLAIGYAPKREFTDKKFKDLVNIADDRMYEDKAAYYNELGEEKQYNFGQSQTLDENL